MSRVAVRLMALGLLACATVVVEAQAPLFSAHSKAQGAPFDLVATELSRLEQRSYLQVPGFHERSAAGARWLMCVYTALAVERGFSHWGVMYPDAGDDVVVVAFSNSAAALPAEVFGVEFKPQRVLGDRLMPVDRMQALCGVKK